MFLYWMAVPFVAEPLLSSLSERVPSRQPFSASIIDQLFRFISETQQFDMVRCILNTPGLCTAEPESGLLRVTLLMMQHSSEVPRRRISVGSQFLCFVEFLQRGFRIAVSIVSDGQRVSIRSRFRRQLHRLASMAKSFLRITQFDDFAGGEYPGQILSDTMALRVGFGSEPDISESRLPQLSGLTVII